MAKTLFAKTALFTKNMNTPKKSDQKKAPAITQEPHYFSGGMNVAVIITATANKIMKNLNRLSPCCIISQISTPSISFQPAPFLRLCKIQFGDIRPRYSPSNSRGYLHYLLQLLLP